MSSAHRRISLNLPEAVEVELSNEGGEVIVLEVLGNQLFAEGDEVLNVEGVAFVRPVEGRGFGVGLEGRTVSKRKFSLEANV
jgi:hypothetical protein